MSTVGAGAEVINRHLRLLAVTLPNRNDSDDNYALRGAVYRRMLAPYSADALAWMSYQACATLNWFPTPHQCIALLESYGSGTDDRVMAKRYCIDYWTDRMEAFLTSVVNDEATQAEIDAAPAQWLRVGFERGLLRLEQSTYRRRNARQMIVAP